MKKISDMSARLTILVLTLTLGICFLSGVSSKFDQANWITEAFAQEVGLLRVTITPQEAIDAGAQWRVDGGTWRDSGVSVGIEAGSHTVEFKEIDGWDAHADIPVTVVADAITEATGNYTVIRSLRVFIAPARAIDAGAQWNVDGGPWQDSGTIVPDLSVGDHTVNYKNVFGWATPTSETVTIVEAQITETTGTYTQLFGSLQVSITPQCVINEGAQWRVDDGHWQDSGTTISGVTAGDHSVIYKGVFGWTRPPDQIVTVYGSQVIVTAGDYTQITTGVTLRVPSDYTTIQAAINAASDGDTVLIADGTYVGLWNKHLDFNGKAIKVASENGPENCIIDCEGKGAGIWFGDNEKQDSVVSGLTITRGFPGIICASSPGIIDCIISKNSGQDGGGGLRIESGHPIIAGSIVVDNDCYALSGGSCKGGGIFSSNGSLTIDKCIVFNNSAGQGGGIWAHNASITNCIVLGNEAAGNINQPAAGVYCNNTTIRNCTISGNTCQADRGSVIACDSSTQITNSIIWNNCPHEIDGAPIITYSDIKGGYPGEGNIDTDPMFVDPDKSDYRLREESPCIDTGTSEGAPATDIDGTPRPQGAGFDMGAYEFRKDIVYISQDGVCYGNTPCYSTIQAGIDWDGVVFAIRAHEGPFPESIVLDEDKEITFQSGWDTTFTTDIGGTQITSMTIGNGTISIDRNCLVIGGN